MKLRFLLLAAALGALNWPAGGATDFVRAESPARQTEGRVFRDVVTPHWLPGNRRFWYRVAIGPGAQEFVLVDAETGDIKRAASAEKLGLPETGRLSTSAQSSLTPARTRRNGEETAIRLHNATAGPVDVFWVNEEGARLPYGRLRPGETKEFHTYAGHVWLVTDADGSPLGFFEATPEQLEVEVDGKPARTDPPRQPRPRNTAEQSPDGKFSVRLANNRAILVSQGGETTDLAIAGALENPLRGPAIWSPDSQHCVIFSVSQAPRRIVTVVESSPRDQLQPKLQTYDYLKPGDALPQVRPLLVSVADKTAKAVADGLFTNNFTPDGRLDIRWAPRGDEFYFRLQPARASALPHSGGERDERRRSHGGRGAQRDVH